MLPGKIQVKSIDCGKKVTWDFVSFFEQKLHRAFFIAKLPTYDIMHAHQTNYG